MKDTLVWWYKDCNRYYITVIATITGTNITDPNDSDPDYFQTAWDCYIIKDPSLHFNSLEAALKRSGVKVLYNNDLRSQYDVPIGLDDILLDYSSSVAGLCIGMAKHAKKIE